MNILSKKNWLLFLLLALLTASTSCDDNNEPRSTTNNSITWDVIPYDMQNGRALIDNISSLQTACSSGKSIGIKSSYVIDGTTTTHVLGNPSGDVSLIYNTNTSWDNYFGWTYGETAVEWNIGAKYTFNAYYPMEAVNAMTEITSSATSPFVIGCNTELFQDDLMMAYKYVDTDLSTFKSNVAVPLIMHHVLSALQFSFSFANIEIEPESGTKKILPYAESDALTAFWIENTEMNKGLYTIGELEFGNYNEGYTINNGESIKWSCISRPDPSTPTSTHKIYNWEDVNGIDFSSSSSSIINKAIAYSTIADNLFSQNNGFIFVIPQENDETFNICFQLKSTGDKVFRTTLPRRTYEPGMKYYYDIYLGLTSVDVGLSIAKWNELKSATNIVL